jgi:dihydroflavonol-4-reductase
MKGVRVRFLVTGGTGFLGQHVVARLRTDGHDIVCLARHPAPELERLGATVAVGDVLDGPSVEAAAHGCDGLFHCAGLVSRRPEDADAMLRVHVQGTRVTLDAARKAGIARAVVASTSGTIAVSQEPREIIEEAETPFGLIARWPYYRSKLYAEKEALDRNVDGFAVVCVNPSLLLGPGDVRGSSTEDVRLFLDGKVQAVPSGGMSFVDARDAADAMVAAYHRGRAGERYLLSGCNCTVREFFGKLERLSGVKAPWLPMPKNPEVAKQAVRFLDRVVTRLGGTQLVSEETVDVAQHFWYVDWSKATRELAFKPRDPTQTLNDTIQDLYLRGRVWPVEKKRVG